MSVKIKGGKKGGRKENTEVPMTLIAKINLNSFVIFLLGKSKSTRPYAVSYQLQATVSMSICNDHGISLPDMPSRHLSDDIQSGHMPFCF